MDKIVPFKKDIIFKTNLSEITSISLEHNLNTIGLNEITGNFIISGDYKIADTSTETESFSYELPFNISMDERYSLEHAKMDIDDFYYEIINDTVLSVNIDVLVQNLEEKEFEEVRNDEIMEVNDNMEKITEELEETLETNEQTDPRCIEDEDIPTTLFDNIDTFGETYKSYKIYIVRDGDTIESILEKYDTTKETLEEYNDLKEIKLGDKIIIPA